MTRRGRRPGGWPIIKAPRYLHLPHLQIRQPEGGSHLASSSLPPSPVSLPRRPNPSRRARRSHHQPVVRRGESTAAGGGAAASGLTYLSTYRGPRTRPGMDSEHWISRLAAAKRFYAAQLGHAGGAADRGGAGMDELEMDEEEAAVAATPEFACPYCYEDHDVASLCVHLEEDHPFEPHAAPCPICSDKVSKDMLSHITMQHGYLFKNRRRLRRFSVPGSQSLSLLSRDLREAHLQVLLGGGGHRSSTNNATNISADPLLSSFGLSFPTSDAEEASKLSVPADLSVLKEKPSQSWQSSIDLSLTREEREKRRKQASVRAIFVQDLLLSTLFRD